MQPRRFAHGVDLIERLLHRRRTGDVARHPDREEQRVEPAVAHAWDVDVAVRVARLDLERLVVDEPLRRVVVRVNHNRAVVQLLGAIGDLSARLRHDERRQRNEGDEDRGAQKIWFHARHLISAASPAALAAQPSSLERIAEFSSPPRRTRGTRRKNRVLETSCPPCPPWWRGYFAKNF